MINLVQTCSVVLRTAKYWGDPLLPGSILGARSSHTKASWRHEADVGSVTATWSSLRWVQISLQGKLAKMFGRVAQRERGWLLQNLPNLAFQTGHRGRHTKGLFLGDIRVFRGLQQTVTTGAWNQSIWPSSRSLGMDLGSPLQETIGHG